MTLSMISEDLRKLVISQPFFASIILKQELKITALVQTAAVDGKTLFINPDWYCDLDPFERVTILAHEVLHLTNKHNLRRLGRDKKLWNIATDLAINKHLVDSPFKLPRSEKHKGIYDDENRFGNGADAESIYSVIYKEAHESIDQMKDDLQKSPDQECEDEDCSPDTTESEDNDDDSSPDDTNNEGGDEMENDSTQESSPSELADLEDSMPTDEELMDKAVEQIREEYGVPDMGDVEDHPQLSSDNKDVLEDESNLSTHKAMNIAKKRGNMPASIEEEIRKDCERKVCWADILSEWIEGICASDYSWNQPHDVYLQDDLILPSMKSEAYGKIVIGIDTSGSMSSSELVLAVTEVFNALDCYHENGQDDVEIELIYCDAVINKVEIISSPSQVTKPSGRGGTSFKPVFDYVKGMIDPPMGLIYITDGYESVYSHYKPQCDVIWMLTSMSAKQFNPCFGKCVEVSV